MSFDEPAETLTIPESEGTAGTKSKSDPTDISLEQIAKMSLEDLAKIAGSLESPWCSGFGWCQGECR